MFSPPIPSTQRLQLGLPGYLSPFAPLAFASQRQEQARRPPSPLVFFLVSEHSTATLGVPPPSPALKRPSIVRTLPVEPGFVTFNLSRRLLALYAQ